MSLKKLIKLRWQRILNSLMIAVTCVYLVNVIHDVRYTQLQVSAIDQKIEYAIKEGDELAQLVMDEGYRLVPYRDKLGYWTVGFGHLMLPHELKEKITTQRAIELLREDYNKAKKSVETKYKWAKGDVKLVLVNMTYQMGENGVSKFKIALKEMKNKNYDKAAAALLDSKWARSSQTPYRAQRLAGRIMQLGSTSIKK